MSEKSINEVGRELRELYQKGATALTRLNFDYAIAIFAQVLQREPGFYECRQALRAAQIKKSGSTTSFFKKVLGGASSSHLIAKGQLVVRRDPLEAISIAEDILSGDANSGPGHRLLAEAALAADMPRTAAFELELLVKSSPRDFDLSMQYGEALTKSGQISKAEALYSELARAHPNKSEVAMALKNLSAKKTLVESGYEALAGGQGSYRDILRNKEQAIAIEQEGRQVKTDVAENLIHEYEARLVNEPNNFKLMRNMAELCVQKKEFERALEYYGRIRSSEGGTDSSLEQAIAETALRHFDHKISQLDPNAADYAERTAQLKAEKSAYQLTECQQRVERYPTDLQFRFEYGVLCFENGKIAEAIAEFQKAQNNPQRRLQSIVYLGRCFAARGMTDVAARRLQEALREKPSFDDEKKEMIYILGSIFEKMGKSAEAIEQYKQIYEVDIGYKDVAAKVDAYYAAGGQ